MNIFRRIYNSIIGDTYVVYSPFYGGYISTYGMGNFHNDIKMAKRFRSKPEWEGMNDITFDGDRVFMIYTLEEAIINEIRETMES